MQIPEKIKTLLISRKFWAAIIGLIVIIIKAYNPNFPFTTEQIAGVVVLIVSFIIGTAIQDAKAA